MNEAPVLEIRDSDGSALRFSVASSTEHELNYLVTVDVGWARASVEVSTYPYGPPTKFFSELAHSWRGWDGEIKWEDLEHRIGLTAVCDKTGHIALRVTLQDASYTGRVELPLWFEAGALDALVGRVAAFFKAANPKSLR